MAQFWAAAQAQAAAADLANSDAGQTKTVANIVAAAKWLAVVKFVTPAIFSVIFALLLIELH